ncbi:MAG: hypothetical protein KAJ78_09690, partial [Acidobacteria bacterium]|nr:hypothetical protein [Acidobacteriota bacterium]
MDVTAEILIKGGLTLLALVAVIFRHRRPGNLASDRAGALLWTLAVVAVLAWPNFGRLHGVSGIHHWEQFHYFLGSKFFPELGYDGLYAASLAAEAQLHTGRPVQSHVRDLRTNEVVPSNALQPHRNEVRQRFSDDRWRMFEADVAYFLKSNAYDYIRRIRLDHGYNPTPTWTFTARLFSRYLPAGDSTLTLLAWIDPVLLACLFLMIFRTYGSRVGCLALIIFGLGYPWRYDWVGGAFLRQDWLAATGIAICLMRRKTFFLAGMLLAYATMVRIFPGAFLVGPVVVGIRQIVEFKQVPRWLIRLGSGFLLGILLCLIAGALGGRGPQAWTEFRTNLDKHHGTWLTNNVGLENILLYDSDTVTRKDVDFNLPEPWLHWQAKMDRLHTERRGIVLGVLTLFLLAIVMAAWRRTPDQAALLGIAIAFSSVILTCYYWIMLCLIPLGRERWRPVAWWLALNLGLFALHLSTPSFEMIFGTMSLALAVFFLAWIGPDAWKTVREIRGRLGSSG